MSDLISREAVLDLLRKRLIETANNNVGFTCDAGQVFEDASERIRYWIDELPSAQPEIIRCNDCKHWTQTTGNMRGFGLGDCDYINAKLVNCNGFCYWAERREDGRSDKPGNGD